MRIAAIYDIHGNLPALEAVVADIRRERVDRIVVGGDVVPGPMPRETIDYLRQVDIPVSFIRGNGDREVLARINGIETGAVPEQFREAMQWNAAQLRPDDVALLESWPPTLRLAIEPLGDVLFCHATPRNDTDIFTRLTPDDRLLPIFAATGARVVVCGHTHMPFDRSVGEVRIVNAGSVGMPFGEPGAYWLVLGPGVQPRHTSYDLTRASERIRATAYPGAAEFAQRNVLRPPSEAEILAAYARVEVK
jgi:putative phosphoesterase